MINDSRMPMHTQGWFDDIATGQDGFLGGDGPDCIEGTLNNDEIYAGGGDDFVRTKDGADIVEGGRGNDTIEGGTNDDCLKGGHESLRDVYDDVSSFDLDSYVAAPAARYAGFARWGRRLPPPDLSGGFTKPPGAGESTLAQHSRGRILLGEGCLQTRPARRPRWRGRPTARLPKSRCRDLGAGGATA